MISVLKNEESIVVRCSEGEYITIDKIKGIVKTIKKIDKSNNSPCNIIIKSISDVRFTLHGERFYERISNSHLFTNSRIRICLEE
ncbi:MAG: hypothetical protein KFKLKKLM_02656 [Flavobacteriales bacterium]|nr:hypothetical protein [Flavobacteriales bacterium]